MTEYVRNNFHIPGQIENWIIIIDLDGCGLLNAPYKVRLEYISILYVEYLSLSQGNARVVSMHECEDLYIENIFFL